jgi:uncharacterized protein YodC (DUF2158 family)
VGIELMEFKPGMRVQLKSGGPDMTIEAVDGDSVTCVWFDKAATLRNHKFLASMIEAPKRMEDILKGLRETDKRLKEEDGS